MACSVFSLIFMMFALAKGRVLPHTVTQNLIFEPCINVTKDHPDNLSDPVFLTVLQISAGYERLMKQALEQKFANGTAKNDGDCSSENRPNFHSPIESKSSCPFYWIQDHQPDRIPEFFMQARCSCNRPRNHVHRHGVYSMCSEIRYEIPVLWREKCQGQQHVYRMTWQNISVACVKTLYYEKPPAIAHTVPTVTRIA